MFYLLSFLVALFSLAAWFRLHDHPVWAPRLRALLLGALGAYGLSVATATGTLDYKLGVAFRDLVVIGLSGLAFLFLARLRKAFWLTAVILSGAMGLYVKFALWPTFSTAAERTALDPQGELLIEMPEGADVATLRTILDQYNLSAQNAFDPASPLVTELDDYLVVDVPDAQLDRLPQIKRAFRESGLIDWLEENEEIRLEPMEAQSPPAASSRFGLNDPGIEQLWGFEAMHMDNLYEALRQHSIEPRKQALIAILDTGIDSQHEDIGANYQTTQSKYDDDPQGHGTHCAGIAASVSNNGVGVASFSTDNRFVRVTSIKVLNAAGMGTQRSIINGMIEAADRGADVISMSLGGRSSQSRQKAYQQAVDYARKKGAIVVAAAGNSNRNAKDYAPVNTPGVIGVSAIDSELQRAVFSNSVQDIKLGLAAPGVQIYSTIPGNKYATYNGTSMATPYVAGLLGLLKSIRPELTPKEAYDILNRTGRKTKNTKETGKLIQPAEALKELLD